MPLLRDTLYLLSGSVRTGDRTRAAEPGPSVSHTLPEGDRSPAGDTSPGDGTGFWTWRQGASLFFLENVSGGCLTNTAHSNGW